MARRSRHQEESSGQLASGMQAKGSRWTWGARSRYYEHFLLGKWLWKLENEDGLWQLLLRKKYLGLSQAGSKPGDSHFGKA